MEIEKTLKLEAPAAQVWSLLLDPQAMGSCVPGMQSIEVISDVEYIAHMHVKISFISARFKLKTRIAEMKAPHYLRAEGTGEDASVASSLRQTSEMFLTERDGGTELRMKVKADVFGRLGTFGLGVMKTKADRMWEEFGHNLAARLAGSPAEAIQEDSKPAPVVLPEMAAPAQEMPMLSVNGASASAADTSDSGWWSRLLKSLTPAPRADGRNIRIEMRRANTTLTVEWPAEKANECAAWLREAMK